MTTIPVSELTLGMYVAELDRPWLGMPFMLQGFLIDDPQQIEILRSHCRVVQVDVRRSTVSVPGAARRDEAPPALGDRRSLIVDYGRIVVGDAPPAPEFIDVVRRLRSDAPTLRAASLPAISPVDGESAIEEEVAYSASIVRDARDAVRQLMERVELNEKVDVERVAGLVEEIGQSVARNPDAVIWLARLKRADDYAYDHAIDVSIHLMVFGSFVGLDQRTVERLGLIGLLQDIGKIHLPPGLLHKPGPLSEDEYALVRSHVASSLELLLRQPKCDRQLLEVISRHHERHDGSGYPQQLKGERIGLMAEMAGLIDTFCAMTKHRPYNAAVSNEQAVADLVTMRGSKFRDVLIDEFVQCIGLYPVGSLVELNTGEVAVVIQKSQVRRLKPKVMILLGPDKTPERRPRTLDLLLDPPTADGTPYRIARALPADAYGIDPGEYYLA